MTKREICERLVSICEDMVLIFNDTDDQRAVWAGEKAREILLDLAAPEDHIADAGKMVREEEAPPGVIAKPGKDGAIEFCWCQKCYAKADVVHDPFGDGEDWSYCKTCGVSFRLKRREEGEE